jgi:uncharacterized repeat protein (TIGR03803 family)
MSGSKSCQEWTLPLLILVALSVTAPAKAQTFSVLYNFGSRSGDPLLPSASLTQGRDGALYGTSTFGGTTGGSGTIFKISPTGTMTVLHSFCLTCAVGGAPLGGLTLRPDGHFIGTTSKGGSTFGNGTIFDLTQTGSVTLLYSFTGGTDGKNSLGPPIFGPDGSYYGTTPGGGGPSGCGTIYKITTNGTKAVLTLLHDFDLTDGCGPQAPLVLGRDGNFYGVTGGGGTSNLGVVFQCTPAGKVTVLHNFSGGNEGAVPFAPLIQGSNGNFYGTTLEVFGQVSGNIFEITPTGTYTVLHTLNETTDGAEPSNIVQATDGNLYGVTGFGGGISSHLCGNGCGTLFQVTPEGSYSVLHNFNGTAGGGAAYGPFQHTNGVLYGVASGGTGMSGLCGAENCGVLYSWSSNLPSFVSLTPNQAAVGSVIEILGQGFNSSTTVSFNGTPATVTKVVSGTLVEAFVPAGAATGFVTATTSTGTLTSNTQFIVTP